MDEYVWLDQPVHKNKVSKLDITEIDSLKISFDGSIVAVRSELVMPFYEKNDVELVRAGYKKPPDNLKVETEDDLYSLLSYYISV